jgi:sodium/potassium/calcium exchanger 6
MKPRAASSAVWGILLCCAVAAAATQERERRSEALPADPIARSRTAKGNVKQADMRSVEQLGKLGQLQDLEKVLRMELGVVDALTNLEGTRKAHEKELEREFLGRTRRVGMEFMVEVEEEGDASDKFAGLTCRKVGTEHFKTSSAADRAHVCSFVKARCAPKTGFVNYLILPYCTFSWAPWLGILAMMLFLGILFFWLCAMVDFLIPALATLSKLCLLRQSVAGITFLAFGNGCSDIFSMTAATVTGIKGMELAIGEVLGNGMLIFCFIQGIIAIITPFTATASEYLRDCSFYLAALVLTFMVLFDGQISTMEGFFFLLLYSIYVLVVIHYDKILMAFGMELEPEEMMPVNSSAAPEHEKLIQDDLYDEEMPYLYRCIMEHVIPVAAKRFDAMEWYEKVVVIVQAPIIILLRLTVPVVSDELPKSGWSRPVTTIQILFLPLLVGLFLCSQVLPEDGQHSMIYFFLTMGIALSIGIILSLLVWANTDEEPPSWHKSLCFVGFTAALLFIYMTATDIVNIILGLGVVFDLGRFSLGVSILAIGIGLQDLVSNIGVARAGFPNMAASACIGAPLLNILLGLGTCAIVGNAVVAHPYPLRLTTQLVVCLCFLFSSVVFAVGFMLMFKFRAEANFGVMLIVLYAVFLFTTIALDEYGTDSYSPARPQGVHEAGVGGDQMTFGEAIGQDVR